MTIETQIEHLLQWLRGEIEQPTTEPELTQFAHDLQQAWMIEQAKQSQYHAFWVERITQLVLGELNSAHALETESFIQANPEYEDLHDSLQTLLAHFEEVDKFKPLEQLDKLKERLLPKQQPTLRPSLAFRGDDPNAPIRLSIPPRYGLEIVLFLATVEENKRFVQVNISSINHEIDLSQVNIWLLSEENNKWYEASALQEINEGEADTEEGDTLPLGRFQFEAVLPGRYKFDMSWPHNQFLEVLDVWIPKG